jgi:hypothetical protein
VAAMVPDATLVELFETPSTYDGNEDGT